jgi:GNAT superfamily N-acetyltransferase
MTYLPQLHTAEEDREYFRAQLREHECLVAVRDAAIVGFAIIGEGWLHHLYVDTGQQSRGIGTVLLAAAKSRSKAGLQLWTFQPNKEARRFYERHGFSSVEETDGSGTEERVPDVRYQWRGDNARKTPTVG